MYVERNKHTFDINIQKTNKQTKTLLDKINSKEL